MFILFVIRIEITYDLSMKLTYNKTTFNTVDYFCCNFRKLFKRLIDQNYCLQSTLYEGDAYAVQGITKTDRLGLLVSGT